MLLGLTAGCLRKLPPQVDDTGLGGSSDDGADIDQVTVEFEGTIATISQTPFGLTEADRTTAVEGSFTYALGLPDQLPQDSFNGSYDHAGGYGALELELAGHTVEGSGSPLFRLVDYEGTGSDAFYYEDGAQLGDSDNRSILIDGGPAPDADIWIALKPGLASDVLIDGYDWTGVAELAHTFSVQDGQGGTVLLQLSAIR